MQTQPIRAEPPDELSRRVLLAQGGDVESLGWLIAHLSPLLRARAEFRLRDLALSDSDADDVVGEVWLVALARLGDLRGEPCHLGRTLLGFLGTTLVHKIHKARGRRRPTPVDAGPSPKSSVLTPFERLSGTGAPTPSALLCHHEEECALRKALRELSADDREVLALRAFEQRPNEEVADLLGLTPAGATRRYQRALARLREHMPTSLFDEPA